MRLSQAARKFNVSTETIVNYLIKKEITIAPNPNTKLTSAHLDLLSKEFNSSAEAQRISRDQTKRNTEKKMQKKDPVMAKSESTEENTPQERIRTLTSTPTQKGFRILGSITLPSKAPVKKPVVTERKKPSHPHAKPSFDRKSLDKEKSSAAAGKGAPSKPRFTPKTDFRTRRKYRKDKKASILKQQEEASTMEAASSRTLVVTEFVTTKELASLMKVSVAELLTTCMNLGRPVSINQRLDKELILFLADEYDYEVEFISIEEKDAAPVVHTDPSKLVHRAPIVSVMGHVDHGKTSLLDYIRQTQVTAGEAGGITQHIGAYEVHTKDDKRIVFLDTPGHQAFTAMRARGAQLTDIAIIIVAADEDVMPQTKEAISHAKQAEVPIVVAINKMDKPGADPDRIKGRLAEMDVLVEELGGKYQSQDISAKTGQGVEELLEKILLEAEILTLKADPTRKAHGTVIEASLDKGRGYLTNLMVQEGTLRMGDVVLAGAYYGKVKAMFDSQGSRIKEAPPATPVQILGLNGAPQAGETCKVLSSEKEARELASKYQNIRQQQSLRAQKRVIKTLEDITDPNQGALSLNFIIKADVDGSVEVLADSLLGLTSEEVKINILHQAVGTISESDVLLAAASKSHIIGFHTKLSNQVKKVADKEKVDIQLYNLIHEATDGVKELIERRTQPESEEVILGHGEVIQTFQIARIGRVAGCHVKKGVIKRNSQVRIIRGQEILFQGNIKKLEVEREEVKEAKEGVKCALSLRNFDNVEVGDTVEAFEVKSL